MKKSFRILGVTVLTAIYCFAISIVTAPVIHAQIQNIKKTEQEKYFSDVASNLFFHTTGSESFVNTFICFIAPVFKNTSENQWATENAEELLFEAKFSQYNLFSENILISNRKSVIIFPFHYFW